MRLCLFCLSLSACSSQPIYQPVEVAAPVAMPCNVPEVPQPTWPTQSLTPQAGLFAETQTLLAELDLRKAYEARLEAAAKACR